MPNNVNIRNGQALKAPRLPVGHTFAPESVREWIAWHESGHASVWDAAQLACARYELLPVLDELHKGGHGANERARLTRLAHQIRASLGLFERVILTTTTTTED
jgi:hypothetical protein